MNIANYSECLNCQWEKIMNKDFSHIQTLMQKRGGDIRIVFARHAYIVSYNFLEDSIKIQNENKYVLRDPMDIVKFKLKNGKITKLSVDEIDLTNKCDERVLSEQLNRINLVSSRIYLGSYR